ncbi:hypothetical protein ACFE04_014149 [Oxalis oulophora]
MEAASLFDMLRQVGNCSSESCLEIRTPLAACRPAKHDSIELELLSGYLFLSIHCCIQKVREQQSGKFSYTRPLHSLILAIGCTFGKMRYESGKKLRLSTAGCVSNESTSPEWCCAQSLPNRLAPAYFRNELLLELINDQEFKRTNISKNDLHILQLEIPARTTIIHI